MKLDLSPAFGNIPLADITTEALLGVLEKVAKKFWRQNRRPIPPDRQPGLRFRSPKTEDHRKRGSRFGWVG